MTTGRHLPSRKEKKSAERPCMKCRKPFASEWIGNRLCEECKQLSCMDAAEFYN